MVVFTIASTADFCGYLWCVRVRARCYVPAPLKNEIHKTILPLIQVKLLFVELLNDYNDHNSNSSHSNNQYCVN